jgi:hypothetical protein
VGYIDTTVMPGPWSWFWSLYDYLLSLFWYVDDLVLCFRYVGPFKGNFLANESTTSLLAYCNNGEVIACCSINFCGVSRKMSKVIILNANARSKEVRYQQYQGKDIVRNHS